MNIAHIACWLLEIPGEQQFIKLKLILLFMLRPPFGTLFLLLLSFLLLEELAEPFPTKTYFSLFDLYSSEVSY